MRKHIALALLTLTCGLMAVTPPLQKTLTPLLNGDFSLGLKHWMPDTRLNLPPERTGFTTQDDGAGHPCLVIRGTDTPDQPTHTLIQHITLKPQDIQGKWVRVGADFLPQKLSGTILLMVREATSKGTIRYRKLSLNRWNEPIWQKLHTRFKVYPPTTFIQLYIQSHYLQPTDRVLMRQLTLTISDEP